MSDDRSLADVPGEAFGLVDVSPEVEPEDFDFEAFLSGVRPTRRAVQVFARADLVAVMEEVAGEYAAAEDDGAPAAKRKAIAARFTEAREAFLASGRWFVLEKRSSEWIEKFRKGTAARLDITLPEDDEKMGTDDRMAMLLEQLAAQIASPTGVTAAGLRKLYEANEGEVSKLVTAMTFVNTQLGQSAKVLARDFSLARSVKSDPKRGSSSRN